MAVNDKTLLVIDDVEENRELLKRRFERRGFKVKVAEDGQEGLMALALNDVNLVFLDLNMPVMNGFTFLEKVQSSNKHAKIPVVVTTSLDDDDTKSDCLNFGAKEFFSKPYDMNRIYQYLTETLDEE